MDRLSSTTAQTELLPKRRQPATSVLSVNSADPDHDSLTLQTPGTYTGTVNWGATDLSNVWHASWSVRYQVVGGQLVRRVLNASGTQVGASELLIRSVDSASGGLKGFRVAVTGPVVNAVVRIRKTFRDNKSYTKELGSSIFLKND